MKTIVKIFLMLFALSTTLLSKEVESNNVLVLYDISDSAPFVTSKKLTFKVARYLNRYIKKLPIPSEIEIQYIGNYMSDNKGKHLLVNRKNPPKKSAKKIANYTIGVYKNIQKSDGKYKSEHTTEIISALALLTVEKQYNTIIIYSDMMEYSKSTMNMYKVVSGTSNKIEYLPKNSLKNCDIIVLGAGVGLNNNSLKKFMKIKSTWQDIFSKAGVKNLKFYSNKF